MYQPEWWQFSWDLALLNKAEAPLGGRLEIREGQRPDRETFLETMQRCYLTAQGWGVNMKSRLEDIATWYDATQTEPHVEFLVLEDGKRVVGGSLLNLLEDSPRHLVSGIFIVEEYRCRGYGTALLLRSLQLLRDKQLKEARVVTQSNVAAARHLYPKFNSRREKLDNCPPLRKPGRR